MYEVDWKILLAQQPQFRGWFLHTHIHVTLSAVTELYLLDTVVTSASSQTPTQPPAHTPVPWDEEKNGREGGSWVEVMTI